jgi:hypothetical protein
MFGLVLVMNAARFGHFAAMLLFALFVSMALGCLTQRAALNWIGYVLRSLSMFIVIAVLIAWLMYPISR